MKSGRPKTITLDTLAAMMRREFESIQREMATKFELEALRKETQAGFAYVNIILDKHMGAVRKETDDLARRVKRLEDAVFKKR